MKYCTHVTLEVLKPCWQIVNRGVAGKTYLFAFLLLVVLSVPSSGQVLDSTSVITQVHITQVRSDIPLAQIYFELWDENASPVYNLEGLESQIRVSVEKQSTDIQSVIPFQQRLEGTAYVLLLDISKSLKDSQFDKIKQASIEWIDEMKDSDQVAIVTFGDSVHTVQYFSADKEASKAHIAGLRTSSMNTQLYEGINRAITLASINDVGLPGRRIIVTFTDGVNDPIPDGFTEQEATPVPDEFPVPIYAIGFVGKGQISADLQQFGANIVRRSGGVIIHGERPNIDQLYATLRSRIEKVYVAQVYCETCVEAGKQVGVNVEYNDGTRSVVGLTHHRLQGQLTPLPVQTTISTVPPWLIWVIGSLLVFLIGLLIFLLVRRQQKKNAFLRSATEPPSFLRRYENQGMQENQWMGRNQWMKDRREMHDRQAGSPKTTVKHGTSVAAAPPPQRIRFTVVGSDPPGSVYESDFRNRIVVGRGHANDILQISGDLEISSKHFEIVRSDGQIWITDLKSLNGTLVEGVPILGRFKLYGGERITVGNTHLRFSII